MQLILTFQVLGLKPYCKLWISLRSADYDCDLYTGYTYTETNITVGLNTTARGNGQGCRLTDTNLPYWTDAWETQHQNIIISWNTPTLMMEV